MSFSTKLMEALAPHRLLTHPFYQEWNKGTIPRETLREYSSQYYHHVSAFPRYISATHSLCEEIEARQVLLENLLDEESSPSHHPELWLRFAEALGEDRASVKAASLLPETARLLETFFRFARSSYEEGLGALLAYEHQVPEVAAFKSEALSKHYGLENSPGLKFFEVHAEADVYHTRAVAGLLDSLSPERRARAENAAVIAAQALWRFLDQFPCGKAA